MKVKTTADVIARQGYSLPSGSVIKDVKVFSKSYRGMWCSMLGSYIVTVPKKDCKIVLEDQGKKFSKAKFNEWYKKRLGGSYV